MRYNLTQAKIQTSFKLPKYSHLGFQFMEVTRTSSIFSNIFIQMKFYWNKNQMKKSQINKIDTILCFMVYVYGE